MYTKSFVTHEVDDAALAASELSRLYREQSGNLGKNKAGLLFCYSDMEVEELALEVSKRIEIDIIGCTTIASMEKEEGFMELASVLVVLSADDADFATVQTEAIIPDNASLAVETGYHALLDKLGEAPKLIYAIPPYKLDIMLDTYTETFTKVAPGIPVIGGLPSYNGNGDSNMTIYKGSAREDRMVMLGISGNIKPVFNVLTVLESREIKKRRVTKAKDNVIYKVDNLTFTEYLEELGMPLSNMEDINNTVSLVANPLLVEETGDTFGDSFKYLRALHAYDLETGSGTAIGKVPEGAYISIHPLDRNEIGAAAEQGIRTLKGMMEAEERNGCRYTTVMAISCIGRHVIMTPNSGVEVESILKEFPKDMTFGGFYSNGEISPLPVPGGFVTFSHNESLVLCAF